LDVVCGGVRSGGYDGDGYDCNGYYGGSYDCHNNDQVNEASSL
jgi:hypothetical protein